MSKFLVLHYTKVGERCIDLLAEQIKHGASICLSDPRPRNLFKSSVPKFKRLAVNYLENDTDKANNFRYDYVVLCGPETTFSKQCTGKRITPAELAAMFSGEWADVLLAALGAQVAAQVG